MSLNQLKRGLHIYIEGKIRVLCDIRKVEIMGQIKGKRKGETGILGGTRGKGRGQGVGKEK